MAVLLPFALHAQITTFPWTPDFTDEAQNATWTIHNNDDCSDGAEFNINYGYVVFNYTDASCSADQWVITPAITLPSSASDFNLSWEIAMSEWEGTLSHYEVRIATSNSTDVSAFTSVLFSEEGDNDLTFESRVSSLASYAGQTIRIAFHHISGPDCNTMGLRSVRVGGPMAPSMVLAGPANVMLGTAATFTANTDVTTVAWTVDGAAQTETGLTFTYTFTTLGEHTVIAAATNAAGTTRDTLTVNVYNCDAIASFPFNEGFENGLSNCWTMVSANEENVAKFGIYADANAYDGEADFRFSSFTRAETNGDYNQFLITPELNLSSLTGAAQLKFWYRGHNANEVFSVKVSSTTNDTAAFTTTLFSAEAGSVPTTWTEFGCTLPANTKYVAINYYGDYQYYLYIDDLYIGAPTAPSLSLEGPENVRENRPAVYTATSTADVFNWTVNGTTVTYNHTATLDTMFATAGTYTVAVSVSNEVGSANESVTTTVFACPAESLPFTADFTDGMGCWENVSYLQATGWFLSSEMMDEPVGQVLSISSDITYASYGYIQNYDVDNWLISPELTMPTTGNYEIAWSVKPFSTSYTGDHYGVYVIKGADSTLLFEETLSADMTDFTQRIAAIPSTVTGNFNIAFRHFDSEDGYVIILDGIQVRALSAPEVTVDGPASIRVGEEATFTATSANATSYAWSINGTAVAGNTTNTLTHTFADAGDYTISVTATNGVGTSAPATMTVNAFACDAITTFPYVADFTNGFGCWDTINSDLYGIGQWMLIPEESTVDGQVASMSGYYYNQQMYDLGVDNWLYSPVMTMPANGALEVAYDALALGASAGYAPEHYGVYVIQGQTETLLYEEDLEEAESVERNVYIPASVTGNFQIAFRHFNTSNGYILVLDNIQVRTQTAAAPTVTLNGPTSAQIGEEVTFTAISTTANTYAWTVDGTAVNTNTSTLTTTFETAGNHTVSVTVTNAYGTSDPATLTVNVVNCSLVNNFPYNEGFDNGLGCWTAVDGNEDGHTWSATSGFSQVTPYAGTGMAASFSWNSAAIDADEYLVSPKLAIPAGSSLNLSWWFKVNGSYPDDYLAVLVSTSTNDINSFTTTLADIVPTEENDEWTMQSVSLAAYAGQDIYVAFHHHDSYDANYILVDEVSISSSNGIADIDDSRVSLYPNPASNMVRINATGIEGNKTIAIVDLNGRTVMEQKGNAQSFTFDVTNIARGAYFVRMTGENVNAVRKLIVK